MPDAPENTDPTTPDATETPAAPATSDDAAAAPKKRALWVKILTPAVSAIVAVVAFFGVRAVIEAASGPSKQQQIEQAVEQALAQFDPPQQLDDVTIITDVKAEPGAIRYHYSLVNVDPTQVTAEVLEGIVGPGLCAQPATRAVLDEEIAMRYTYLVEATGDTYELEFTKGYC